jgi:simple sugar transport system permease protein
VVVDRRRLTAAARDVGVSTAVAVAALALGLVIVAVSGKSATAAGSSFFRGAFGGDSIGATLADMIPLSLVALGWIVVFKGGRFHIGFQGQLLIGGLFAVIAALHVDAPAPILVAVVAVAGVVGGALWAWLAAILWARRDVNEIVSTLLLNLIAVQIIGWVVRGPLQEPTGTLPQTDPLPDSALWPHFFDQVVLRWDVVLIPAAVALVAFALIRTTAGFRLRLVGTNPELALQSGVSPRRVGAFAIVVSGALAGLAGAAQVTAVGAAGMTDNFDSGFGFQGIAVALLARNSPWAVVPSALLFAALRQGGGVIEAEVGVSSALVDIVQGIVIVAVIGVVAWLAGRRRDWTRGGALGPEVVPSAQGVA